MSRPKHSLSTAVLLFGALAISSGCLTYSDVLEDAHTAARGGDWLAAEERLNALLGVDSRAEVPEDLDSDKTVAILERALVLQAQGAFEESRRDFAAAEAGLEAIDFDHDAGGKISTYLYSASEANYAAPPVERMALYSYNMLNYLAMRQLNGAVIEARRYQVMREFLESQEDPPRGRLGAYLAGFIFEHKGEPERAIRYYEEVLEKGPMPSLDHALARVAARTSWRGPAVTSALERARSGSADVPAARDPGASDRPPARRSQNASASAEILVVASLGRSPRKVAERIPIGAAVGIAGTFFTGDLDILERSIFKVLVFPEMKTVPSIITGVRISIDGRAIDTDIAERIGSEVSEDYDKVKPALIGQALSRLVARAAISEGTRVAGREANGGSQALALILALSTEAMLTTLDKPDTRSWSFLPDQVLVARIPVAPGTHEVELQLAGSGSSHRQSVVVQENSFATVVITEPR